jgi:hypothetical protein
MARINKRKIEKFTALGALGPTDAEIFNSVVGMDLKKVRGQVVGAVSLGTVL